MQYMTTRYEPGDRPNHTFRERNDTWYDLTSHAKTEGLTITNFISDAVQIARLDYWRCGRCGMQVPVRFGDLRDMAISEAVKQAAKTAARQKCRAHEPVRIGFATEPGGDVAAAVEVLRTQVDDIRERMSPTVTPGAVPFRPPAVTR